MIHINTQVRQRIVFILVILVCALPFAGAWLVYNFTDTGKSSENNSHGTLITPPGLISNLKLISSVSGDSGYKLHGKWGLVYLENSDCARECKEKLNIALQLKTALASDGARLQVILAIPSNGTAIPAEIRQNDPIEILILQVDDVSTSEIYAQARLSYVGREIEEGTLYLIDPLGNLMMRYPPESDPAGILKDMKRLLRYSRIG